jgi:hypothetical protein
MLGGFALAGNTPWPKWTPPLTGTHYYINAPNAQGPNGEGDAALMLYLSTEFAAGDLVTGMNIETYDFSGAGYSYKACEMRYESAFTPGCPDWTTVGRVPGGWLSPVPYISNWPSATQFPFPAPVPPPIGFNTVCTIQYMPGQNILTSGCPLVGATGTANGFSYLYNALSGSCAGLSVDWCIGFYGNKVPPEVLPIVTLINDKYGTDSDTTAMCKPAGLKMVIHLVNNTGMLWGPGNFSLFARGGLIGYQGWAGTGLDILSALSSGALTSPLSVVIPPTSLGGSVPLGGNLGGLLEYSFSAFTVEGYLFGGSPAVSSTYLEDAMFCPTGCQDDNTLETSYYVQSPQLWGDGQCKRFTADLLPSGAFTVAALDWSPGDFGGAGSPLYKAELRTDGTYGDGYTPDLSAGGFLCSFGLSSCPAGTLYRSAAVTAYSFAAPPAGNIYARCLFIPAYFLIAIGTDTLGVNHKGFSDSSYSLGTGAPGFPNGPDGEALPFNGFPISLMMRLVTTTPFDGDVNGNGSVTNVLPSIALAK